MLKLVITEIKSTVRTWDELVAVDGIKAVKGIVDEGTTMERKTPLTPHLDALYAHRSALQAVLTKLQKALNKLAMLVDQAEKVYFEAYRVQWPGLNEPLWVTWTLERFVDSIPPLLSMHDSHLTTLRNLSSTIASPQTSFDNAKLALERWRDLSIGGERWEGVREWEDIVGLEMGGVWGEEEEPEEEDMGRSGGGRKGKKGRR
ncbi:hypothetical protein EHS25_008062 [Saitozyma podzolica]|uniref:Uncharacterized protein n=1 Tax=Saitozyma podzolica TaxID=1890683 RepID=A0A427YNH9_9TREE|nr:hypothetical protein EHS25_008062 [Saitozyma podzolica]